MNSKLKKFLNALLILGAPVVVLIIGINNGDLVNSIKMLRSARWGYLLAGVLCLFGFLLLGGISIRSALRCQGFNLSNRESFIASVTGEFYSNVTPGATGGQPMKIYRLHKSDIPVGAASAATAVQFVFIQLMATLLTTVLGIVYWPFLREQINVNMPILIVGYTLNTLAALGILILSLFRKPVRIVINLVVRVCTKLRLFKNPDQKRSTFIHTADTYYEGMHKVMRHKSEIIRQALICGAQLVCSMSIACFVNRSLGFTEHAYPTILMMSLMEYMSAAYAPLPGASGAREGVFSLYFSGIFPDDSLFMGMLIWRFISFYLSLIIGVIVVTSDNLKRNHRLSLDMPEDSIHMTEE